MPTRLTPYHTGNIILRHLTAFYRGTTYYEYVLLTFKQTTFHLSGVCTLL